MRHALFEFRPQGPKPLAQAVSISATRNPECPSVSDPLLDDDSSALCNSTFLLLSAIAHHCWIDCRFHSTHYGATAHEQNTGSRYTIEMAQLPLRGVSRHLAATIAGLLLLSIVIITVVPLQIIVPGRRLTTSFRVAYNIVGTVIATIIARYTAGEIQKQWLRLVNHQISDLKYQVQSNPHIGVRWRAILGISSWYENFTNIKDTGLTLLSFLATALITAAIVAAITLTDTKCSSMVHPPLIHSGLDTRCMGFNTSTRSSPLWELSVEWEGPGYFATSNLGCPAWSGVRNLGDINIINPKKFAYARNGVAVESSAVGAPEIFYTQFPRPVEPIERPYGHQIIESNLRSVSHCLPVMARNPVKCKSISANSVRVNRLPNSNQTDVSLDFPGCSYTQPTWEAPEKFGIMASRLCESKDNIGQATVALGATGVISLTLAASMGDKKFLGENGPKYEAVINGTNKDLKYAVSCEIDVPPTIQWRNVTLTLEQGHLDKAPSYSKTVSAQTGCGAGTNSSGKWNIGPGYWANAVAGLKPPLSEGRYWNGVTNTIFATALSVSNTSERYSTAESWQHLIRTDFGFNQSTNALEDVLGLTAGITMSQLSTKDSLSPMSPLADKARFHSPVEGRATFACTRVGSGSPSGILFAIPPLLAAILGMYLIWIVPHHRTKWKTSRLGDIMAIGMAGERELHMAYKSDFQRKSKLFSVEPVHFRDLKRSNTIDGIDDEEGTLLSTAVSPVATGPTRWVTDAHGTRAIPARIGDNKETYVDNAWTTAVPSSPVRLRHEDGYSPLR